MARSLEDLDRRTSRLEQAQAETTDTLRWVVAKLGRIQAVQDEHTLRLERLETKMDGLEARFDRLEARFDGLEARFDVLEARFDGLEAKLDGLIEALPRLITEAARSLR
jgi:chromosome segregation ATPase